MSDLYIQDQSLRSSNGLLKTVTYPRNLDGSVNWRAMLLPEHLYVNPDFEDELKVKFNVKSRRDIDVTKCADYQLLVLLEGWRYLLKMRGVRSVDIKMDHISNEKASATCSIELIGNYETNGEPIRWSDSASASLWSVSGSFQVHLEAMAANRAFARCVRAVLGIKIYGKDEYDPKANAEYVKAIKNGDIKVSDAPGSVSPLPLPETKAESIGSSGNNSSLAPWQLLRDKCASMSHTFESIRKSAISNKADFRSDPGQWKDWEAIQPADVYTLLSKITATKKSKS
jgi:hypothetical protein